MKRIPIFLSFFFLAITLNRVAELASRFGASWMAILFAIGLGAGVFLSGYWLDKVKDDGRLQFSAAISLLVFMAGDLSFNGAEVWAYMSANNLHDGGIMTVVGIIYAVFPTLAAAVLGMLQAQTSRQPDAKKSVWRTASDTVNAIVASVAPVSRQVASSVTDDAPRLTEGATSGDTPPAETPAQEYARVNGVSLRTAQRHLKPQAKNVNA